MCIISNYNIWQYQYQQLCNGDAIMANINEISIMYVCEAKHVMAAANGSSEANGHQWPIQWQQW